MRILLRLELAFVIILAGLLFYWGLNQFLLRKTRDKSRELPFTISEKPTILYFTTPDCMPCKTVQRPALKKVRESMGDRLEIIQIDASEQVELAKEWRVLSVPTTFIIDAEGKTRYINHGVARLDKLLGQINSLG